MKATTLAEIASVIRPQNVYGLRPEQLATGIAIDSRKVKPGDIFFALAGRQADGHRFVDDAFRAGAAAAIVERTDVVSAGNNLLVVDSVLQALQALAGWYRGQFPIPVVAVTGSSGKTTTKEMTAAVLNALGPAAYNFANLNNELGLPLSLLGIEPEHVAGVFEMGMRGRDEIRQLCAIAAPQIGIITNIGSAHMECLGSQEQIALAKWELVEGLPPDGIAVLNGDDVWLRELADRKREARKIVWYGMGNDCEIRARSVSSGLERTCFQIALGDVRGNAEIRLPGTHNVYNSLAAIAAGWLLQIPLTVMVSRLTELTLPSMRMQLHSTAGDILILNDTYNANPDSTISALKVLAGVEGRRIAVLGDMFELGWFSQQGHRQVGVEAANSELAYLITVGRAASEIAAGAIAAGLAATRVRHFNSKEDAGAYLQTLLAAGDAVLVKASRGMQMEELVARLMDDQRLRSESGL